MANVTFEDVGKVYADGTLALSGFSLEIGDGEFMVLVGPSGCGKTTALRILAGLEEISSGAILIGGREVNDVEPRDRDVAMVFQNYALYPHLSVFENMAFGLRTHRVPKREIRRMVDEIARLLGLEHELKKKPGSLSGGQRQRVAMGRAIVRDPQVFAMDEPLSNLDAKLRVQMRSEISRLQRRLGTTMVYVTHDQVEAMTMADRIAVLRRGVIQQVDKPEELFRRPANLFVASFIGSPAMNLVEADYSVEGETRLLRIGSNRLELPPRLSRRFPNLVHYAGRSLVVGVRPEYTVEPSGGMSDKSAYLRGVVQLVESLGSEYVCHLEIDARPVVTDEVLEVAQDIDPTAMDTLRQEAHEHRAQFRVRINDTQVKPGDEMTVAVDRERLHFFDLDNGTAIA